MPKLCERTKIYNFSDADRDILSPQQKQLEALIKSGKDDDLQLHLYNDSYILENISTIRQNLLEWISFDNTKKALELDGKTGLLTEILCRRFSQVTSVIANRQDAYLNFIRNRNYLEADTKSISASSRLEIRTCGFFDDQKCNGSNELFDVVFLIGMDADFFKNLFFDYNDISDPNHRLQLLLSLAYSSLADNGELVLAVNNRLGIQYWSGTLDRCSENIYDSICGNTAGQTEYSFSKKALIKLLNQEKFCDISFYYPSPDYRFPQEIFSDSRLPRPGDIRPVSVNYERDHYQLFDKKNAIDSLCEDGLYDQFANSYLVICKKGK